MLIDESLKSLPFVICGHLIFNSIIRNRKMRKASVYPNADVSVQKKEASARSKRKTKNASKKRVSYSRPELNTEYRQDLYQKFQQFRQAQAFKRVQKMFYSLIGRHSIPTYSPEYGFREQWQVTNKQSNESVYRTTLLYLVLNTVLLLVMNAGLWGVSVKLVFDVQTSVWVYYVMAVAFSIQIVKKVEILLTLKYWKDRILVVNKQVLGLIFSLVMAFNDTNTWVKVLGVGIIILLYDKASEIYENIKIFHLSSKYREIVDLFDLFVLILTISHIFALLLFAITLLNPDSNWMTSITMQDHQWSTRYIYSLYFACTTLLTVGYGDIAPSNVTEIMAVLLTQVIGIASFAYAVNKIGVALTNITERNQKLQKNLSNVEQMANTYRLNPQIICRMRSELVRDKTLSSEMNINEQNQLLSSFSEDLREEIETDNCMRVIKRSMFIIGNWTGKMQGKIARKLVKEIYATDQFLHQAPGKEKIYILDKGKIDVITNMKFGFKLCFQKVLKTLTVLPSNQVLPENVYGYSAVISQRQINLNAIAKQNCIVYSLSKANLFQLLAECEQDLQHFHELKSKIIHTKIPEEIEAPAINNYRQHYSPSAQYIISVNNYNTNKNQRVLKMRSNRRTKLKCENFNTGSSRGPNPPMSNTQIAKSLFLGERSQKLGTNHLINEIIDAVESRESIKPEQIVEQISLMDVSFEACKQFQRYYKKSNYENVIYRLNNNVYFRKSMMPRLKTVRY